MATTAVEAWREGPEGSAVVRQYLKLLRALGCCFVEGLFADDPSELEAVRCSWYLAYSLFILSALWVTAAVNIVRFIGSGTIMGDILGIACFMYSVQLTSVVAPAFFSAHNIVQALPKSSRFECWSRHRVNDRSSEKARCTRPGHRLPEAWERSLRRTFTAVIVFIVIQISTKICFYLLVLSPFESAFSVARSAAILAIMTVATVWSGAPAACTVLASRWLSAHVRYIREKLELIAAQRGKSDSARRPAALFTADMLAATRRDLSELRRILRAWNGAVQLGLLAHFASDTLSVCCALYILLASEAHCMRVVAQAMVRSALAGFALFAATWSSDDVAKQVEKLKYNIDSYVESGLVCPRSRKEVAGGIFIHTTILIQMMRLGSGCVGGSVPTKNNNYTEDREEHLIATYFY